MSRSSVMKQIQIDYLKEKLSSTKASLKKAEKEVHKLTSKISDFSDLVKVANEFIAKVDRGEARSKRSYQAFKDALEKIK